MLLGLDAQGAPQNPAASGKKPASIVRACLAASSNPKPYPLAPTAMPFSAWAVPEHEAVQLLHGAARDGFMSCLWQACPTLQ